MQAVTLGPTGPHTDLRTMRKAAIEFEGQALGALLQPMFDGLSAKGPFGGGAGEAQWRPMMVNELGRAVARAGGIGLADAVLRQMLATQESRAQEVR